MKNNITNLCTFNNLGISAYKTDGEAFGDSPIVHMIIKTRDNKEYEHMIPLAVLEINGAKALDVLYYFNRSLKDKELDLIKEHLLNFAYNTQYVENRFDGWTTHKIYEHILNRLPQADIVKQDKNFIYIKHEVLEDLLNQGEQLFLRSPAGALESLMDGYIVYNTDGDVELYGIRKDVKEK